MPKGFQIQIYAGRYQDVQISDHGYKLWLKWYESRSDSDWKDFADWVQDEIAEQMVFYIEEAIPTS